MLAASVAGVEVHQEAAAGLVVHEVLLVAGVGLAVEGAVDEVADSVVDVVGVEEDLEEGAALVVVAADLVAVVEAEVDTRPPASSNTATSSMLRHIIIRSGIVSFHLCVFVLVLTRSFVSPSVLLSSSCVHGGHRLNSVGHRTSQRQLCKMKVFLDCSGLELHAC